MAAPAKQETGTADWLDPKYDDYDHPVVTPEAKDGHPGHLTEDQKLQVWQLRKMLEEKKYTKRLDTLTMLRFLRARKWDVNLAMQMFVDCEKWREEIDLDNTIPKWDYPEKPEIQKYYQQYYHKTDKDGRPVYFEELGKIDLAAMYNITTADRMLTNLAVEYEKMVDPRLPACSRKAGHLLETCTSVMDMKGVGITKAPSVYGYVKQASALSQNYYPERLGRFYMINAPWGFSTVWSVVKGWLDPVTVKKIHILGGGYQKELLSQISAENLPKQYGGTCACAGGCENSDMGPWREEQWAKPPKWAKKADETTTAPAATTTAVAPVPATAPVPAAATSEPAGAPAPAPA